MNSMSRRIIAAALPLMAVGLASAAHSQGNPPENDAGATLFENVRIFDGKRRFTLHTVQWLIKGNIIERISTEPIAAEPGVTVIAGNGRTLMPGLIDAHWHAMLIRPNPAQAADPLRTATCWSVHHSKDLHKQEERCVSIPREQ